MVILPVLHHNPYSDFLNQIPTQGVFPTFGNQSFECNADAMIANSASNARVCDDKMINLHVHGIIQFQA